ncbi:hypothetical protein P4V86_22425 [Brevibacillus laterosporus]|uniref:hypothetical protein n=1 Tax=Brevibacillus laterosporus TaxID=1465 RepID=UPI0003661999|nr:hypothetical protein [Brevibacillus laterosporus]ATO49872.1 hypothetical protein BrL25_12720 [Brevibacillus laterosporus DSM 25]MED2006085.1 hypothetical protein [Brevibacillus laterosporus]MED4762878.1 hypothetical protein [Brevibacillus laterosporus]
MEFLFRKFKILFLAVALLLTTIITPSYATEKEVKGIISTYNIELHNESNDSIEIIAEIKRPKISYKEILVYNEEEIRQLFITLEDEPITGVR